MRAKQYDDVIDFTLGDPDIPTPDGISDVAIQSLAQGKTRYVPNAGVPELRRAVAEKESKHSGLPYSEENVLITVGATEAVYLAFMALLDPGDEVLILAPYWVQYENIVKLFGGKPVIVDDYSIGFEPSLSSIEARISDKTKAIVVNSPNNPSGYVYSSSFMRGLGLIAQNKAIYILADEVYRSLIFEGEYDSISRYSPMQQLVLLNSFSKQFAMTGWRVGYMVAHKDIIDAAVKFQQNIAVCVPSISQYAALEALRKEQFYAEQIKAIFCKRRELLLSLLQDCKGITCDAPRGTFYAFLNISALGMKSMEFACSLLDKAQVALIPGVAFGGAFDKYVRLAFTLNESKIEKGLFRLSQYVDSLS